MFLPSRIIVGKCCSWEGDGGESSQAARTARLLVVSQRKGNKDLTKTQTGSLWSLGFIVLLIVFNLLCSLRLAKIEFTETLSPLNVYKQPMGEEKTRLFDCFVFCVGLQWAPAWVRSLSRRSNAPENSSKAVVVWNATDPVSVDAEPRSTESIFQSGFQCLRVRACEWECTARAVDVC